MDARELRIGNWVQTEMFGHKRYWQVSSVEIHDCEHYGDNWSFKPIPLTPEILEKAGFVKVTIGMMTSWDYDITPSFITKGWKKLVFAGDYLYLQEWNGREPLDQRDIITLWNRDVMKQFYLHQLQNLFYILCGYELPINL